MGGKPQTGGVRRVLAAVGWTSPIAAVAAEVCLLIAWGLLGEAPSLALASWIWPLAWLMCVGVGGLLRPRKAPEAGSAPAARYMLRDLASGALLVAVPLIVALYGLAAMVMAWRAAR